MIFVIENKKLTMNHNENSSVLCRICSCVLTDYTYHAVAYWENIDINININVKNDTGSVHPPLFCLKCYATVQNCIIKMEVNHLSSLRYGVPILLQVMIIVPLAFCDKRELRVADQKAEEARLVVDQRNID